MRVTKRLEKGGLSPDALVQCTRRRIKMPKMKTHKATAKRKITGRGKVRRRKQGSSHSRGKKSKRARREMRQGLEVVPVDVKRIERLLGTRLRKRKRKR